MNFVCVCLDRLHSGYLGCYGNTWVATPALNRLAAEGAVLQNVVCDTTDLASAYESLWRGSHAAERTADTGAIARPTLVELARAAGLHTLLVADDPTVGEHPAGAAFDEKAEFDPPTESESADDEESTHVARLFSQTLERVAAIRRPFLLWFHAQAMNGPWDAPLALRNEYADEDDPPPPKFIAVPHRELPDDVDLDERFGISQAYAGQVTHIDACLGGLLEQLEESGLQDDTAVVVFAPRGIALGEHGAVGRFDDRLHDELVHVPCLIRLPGGRAALRRSHALVQPCDLYWTLAELLGGSTTEKATADQAAPSPAPWGRSVLPLLDGTADTLRDRALVVGKSESGIRTGAWYLRSRAEATSDAGNDRPNDEPADQLYVKPDDLWEVNDVANRAPEVVEQLRLVADATLAAMWAATEPPALAEVLAEGWE